MTGFQAAIAKFAALGTMAKATVATTTALSVVLAGATGVLSLPKGQEAPVAASAAAHRRPAAAVNATVETPSANASNEAAVAAAPTPSPAAAASASARSATTASVPTSTATRVAAPTVANVPTPPIPNITIPTIPSISNLPNLPPCLTDLIPTGASAPDPFQLVAQLPQCILSVVQAALPLDLIRQVLGSLNLPVDFTGCLSAVLGSIPTFATGDISRLPQMLSACMPTGQLPGMGSSFGMRSPGAPG
jgi:hypothetical protein